MNGMNGKEYDVRKKNESGIQAKKKQEQKQQKIEAKITEKTD